jgi:hypothetical protein
VLDASESLLFEIGHKRRCLIDTDLEQRYSGIVRTGIDSNDIGVLLGQCARCKVGGTYSCISRLVGAIADEVEEQRDDRASCVSKHIADPNVWCLAYPMYMCT